MRIIMHGHHAATLFSILTSLEGRREEVLRIKPVEEQELRLALMKDVTDLLPQTSAREAWEKAREACIKALTACIKAEAAYDKAVAAYMESFDAEAFHAEHCHPRCPWDGQSIFARGTGIEVLAGAS